MNLTLPVAVTSVLDSSLESIYALEPWMAKTVILVPDFVKTAVSNLADQIGMDVDTVDYVLALFLCYPLGMIISQIPFGYVTARHLFSFLLGAVLLQFTLGVQWIHLFITTLVSYAMMITLPRKTLKVALPAFAMIYLLLGHLHRQYVNYLGWDLDFTSAQMVATMKLYMIAYNLYDGEQLERQRKDPTYTADRASQKCAQFALPQVPSLLEFMGFMFCFSTVLAGPANEFSVYRRVIDGSVLDTVDEKTGKVTRQTPPSRIWPTLRPFLTCLLNLTVFLVLEQKFPLLHPENPQTHLPAVVQPQFLEYSFAYRALYCWIAIFGFRQKYYFAWKNAEGAQNIWYAGLDAMNPDGTAVGWETSSNIDWIRFETSHDIQTLSKEWNKKTSFWLTRYVYTRTGGNLLLVYGTSAVWHGFYPGYYLFFLSAPLLTICDRMAKKKLSPYFSKEIMSPYGIAGILLSSWSANYIVLGFALLSAEWTYQLFASFYFYGHILPILFYVALSFLPTPKKEKKE